MAKDENTIQKLEDAAINRIRQIISLLTTYTSAAIYLSIVPSKVHHGFTICYEEGLEYQKMLAKADFCGLTWMKNKKVENALLEGLSGNIHQNNRMMNVPRLRHLIKAQINQKAKDVGGESAANNLARALSQGILMIQN